MAGRSRYRCFEDRLTVRRRGQRFKVDYQGIMHAARGLSAPAAHARNSPRANAAGQNRLGACARGSRACQASLPGWRSSLSSDRASCGKGRSGRTPSSEPSSCLRDPARRRRAIPGIGRTSTTNARRAGASHGLRAQRDDRRLPSRSKGIAQASCRWLRNYARVRSRAARITLREI
jgi:hypothetical protein